eukprot:5970137-Pleurochrysis_carterae.AAC.1
MNIVRLCYYSIPDEISRTVLLHASFYAPSHCVKSKGLAPHSTHSTAHGAFRDDSPFTQKLATFASVACNRAMPFH